MSRMCGVVFALERKNHSKFVPNPCTGDVTFQKAATEFKIVCLVGFSADWLTNSLALSLTYSITAKTMGLIFTLFDFTSSRGVPASLRYLCSS